MSAEVSCPVCFEPFPFSHFEAHVASHRKPLAGSSNLFEKTRKLLGKSTFVQNELNLNKDLILSGLDDATYNAFMELSQEEREGDLTSWITKRHYVSSPNCTECGLSLGLVNGNNNCAKCGKSFCNLHSKYQMKLSVDARHDPVNGIWAFCCRNCYESRKGYKYTLGVTRRRTIGFQILRAEKTKDLEKEVNKIQNRLRDLLEAKQNEHKSNIIANVPPVIKAILGKEDANPEQIVPWIDAPNCSSCNSTFTALNRKHHCRLCGKIICQSCSIFIESIRTCSSCNYLVSLRKYEERDSEMQKAYETYIRYKNAIINVIPQYNNLISRIKAKDEIDYRDQEYQLALKIRKDVLDMGVLIEQLGKRVKSLDGRLGVMVYIGMMGFVKDTVGRMELLPMRVQDVEKSKIPNPQRTMLEETRVMLTGMFNDAIGKRRLEDAEAIKQQLTELEAEMAMIEN